MPEIWKDIPGYEGRYQASTEGQIRSVDATQEITPKDGESKNSIAKCYGISRTAVRYIANGEHFGWLST